MVNEYQTKPNPESTIYAYTRKDKVIYIYNDIVKLRSSFTLFYFTLL